ncbi:MAG: chorismate-binding protein [Maribacter sp.]
MFSELLKSIENQYAKNLPFVVYRKPKEEDVQAVFQEDIAVHQIKDFTKAGFVFAPFDSLRPAILIPNEITLTAKYEPQKVSRNIENDSFENNASQKEFHINLVKKGIFQIENSAFKKVVLSRKVEILCDTSPLNLFQNLLDNYATAFCYLWHHPEIGTWLGATPEILLKSENQQFTTMSLAGTQKYVEDENPLWGNKELEEQQLVTDYIANALQNSVSHLNIGERESTRAGNLWHLKTKLTGRIENGNLAKIIDALHPTPAVCGLPLNATKTFILENENYNREYYTGFLGELNFKSKKDRTSNSRNQENKAYRLIKNETILFVNLRCMQLKDSSAHIYVGGGVTQDSDPEKEWQETVAKSKTMTQILTTD